MSRIACERRGSLFRESLNLSLTPQKESTYSGLQSRHRQGAIASEGCDIHGDCVYRWVICFRLRFFYTLKPGQRKQITGSPSRAPAQRVGTILLGCGTRMCLEHGPNCIRRIVLCYRSVFGCVITMGIYQIPAPSFCRD